MASDFIVKQDILDMLGVYVGFFYCLLTHHNVNNHVIYHVSEIAFKTASQGYI